MKEWIGVDEKNSGIQCSITRDMSSAYGRVQVVRREVKNSTCGKGKFSKNLGSVFCVKKTELWFLQNSFVLIDKKKTF